MKRGLKYLDRICFWSLVLTICVAGGMTLFMINREYRNIRFENEVFMKKKQDLSMAEANLSQFRDLMEKAQAELKRLNERIPETAKIGEFLKQIHDISLERGIKLLRVQHLPSVEVKRYTRIPVRLMVEGRFRDIYFFVRDLETMNRICILDSLKISKSIPETVCRAELTASVFQH